jgi:sRNA-binding carbon storage regulator CsrA
MTGKWKAVGGLRLFRRRGEKVFIKAPDGTKIVVTVEELDFDKGKVTLNFVAPQSYAIRRDEDFEPPRRVEVPQGQ